MPKEGTAVLEPLISSRIRRTLLEHILTHPDERFYLRGLARELSLAVSPVRRELKRLEQLGMLKTYEEANVRFYVVDQTCPLFVQLKQTWGQTQGQKVLLKSDVDRKRPRLSMPLVGALSLTGFLVVVGVTAHLAMTNQRLLSFMREALNAPRAQVTVVESTPRASGEMRSTHWRLLPGAVGVGGLSPGTNEGSY